MDGAHEFAQYASEPLETMVSSGSRKLTEIKEDVKEHLPTYRILAPAALAVLLAATYVAGLPGKAKAQNSNPQVLTVQTIDALTGNNLGTGLAGAAHDPADGDSLIANNYSNATGAIILFLSDGLVGTQSTSWGAIKGMFKGPSGSATLPTADKSHTAETSADPFNYIRLLVYGPDFVNYNNHNVPLIDGDNYMDVWMIPNTPILASHTYKVPPGVPLTIDTFTELLKEYTGTFPSESKTIISKPYFPIEVTKFDANTFEANGGIPCSPEDFEKFVNAWYSAEAEWDAAAGTNVIDLVDNAFSPTSGTVYEIRYSPSSQLPGGFEYTLYTTSGDRITGAYGFVGDALINFDQGTIENYLTHMMGHFFGLNHTDAPKEVYIMNPDVTASSPNADEGNVVKAIHNLPESTDMNVYETE